MAEKAAAVSQPRDYPLIVEKDVKIPLRDGTFLYGDVFRPDGGAENTIYSEGDKASYLLLPVIPPK